MAETGFFRGEGGHVWEMNLPLGEAHARRVQEGALVRVNEDGSTYTEPAAPSRPGKSASKKDWVAYAVSQGADEAEAESKTRDELAEAYGDTEPQ
ncbi:hypothetical protein ACFWHW_13180 [Streptomyces pharetrae]|uniref:hypothetical protein n=1 Tax=Streptomyces pharetrae TaxID=291370 RepID=UPI003667DA46